jgi:hypothetical protein
MIGKTGVSPRLATNTKEVDSTVETVVREREREN